MIKFDLLKAEDIEVRPAMNKNGKATLLLYQNSRTTMDALDKAVGEFNWQITYKEVNGQTYGALSIWDENKSCWITKEDTGDESNISEKKGQSSDILKRCAVRFGYGRELYTAPKILVEDDGYGNTGYIVSSINYNDKREIISLSVANRFNKEVFTWSMGQGHKTAPQHHTKTNTEILQEFCSAKKLEEGVNKDELVKFFNYYKPKMATWNNTFKASDMYNKWINRA